ncbi:kirola-like [Dorcoceras hygrometricum]|uniref:Kirola-like n=1 Tax=Dorcoceras hygrometricum TaxID=472368 RepID=A0A2Z7A4S2_9LAMI|nr:kirola-like [Dorcoceras hygrometricum]
MGLTGKLTAQIEYKYWRRCFHEVFRYMPHEVSMSPELIQGCDLLEGDLGGVGSIIYWKYTHDGTETVAKEIVDAIAEEKEGDMMELYKKFEPTFHVDAHGDVDLVTWTFEYEKLHDDVEEPLSLLGLCINLTRHIELHHLNKKP